NLDPTWRAEAAALKRTWDLLDYLPQPEPSPHFTERTMSRLEPLRQPVRTKKRRRKARPWRRLARWLALGVGWAAALVLAALIGYHAFLRAPGSQAGEQELIRDLRIIENMRYYDAVDDIDLLKQLDNPDL